jgi:sigma-54 dependent transcriptional regulator, flagellar regulatory protein
VYQFSHLLAEPEHGLKVLSPQLAGNSICAHALQKMVMLSAETSQTVLLTGPMGSGKKELAKAIHAQSAFAADPFIDTDCLQVGEDHFAIRWEGTLFLSEIWQLSSEGQSALLDWLDSDDGQYVRLIASTSQSLAQRVESGDFNPELHAQLSPITIPCPPLAQRPEDIPAILQRLWAENACGLPPIIGRDGWACLRAHNWPGNLAELRQIAAQASRLHGGRNMSVEQVENLLGKRASRQMSRPGFSLKQHLAREEKLFLIEALLSSEGVVQAAANRAGLKRTTFVAKMKRHGIMRP